jgi:hypothetical protein
MCSPVRILGALNLLVHGVHDGLRAHDLARLPGVIQEGLPSRLHSSLGQISPINFERLNVQKKEDAKTHNLASSVDNTEATQPVPSIDCDRQVDLIENTQEVKNL